MIAGLPFPTASRSGTVSQDPASALVQRKLLEALTEGRREIVLELAELEALPDETPPELPDALAIVGAIVRSGLDPLVRVDVAVGPSGARLLGRFAADDAAIATLLARHLEAEEALAPDAVHAEIVHLPATAAAPVLERPPLRRHEIRMLASAGVDPEHVIPLADLELQLHGNTLTLRSRRLGCEVLPRLSSAHAFHEGNIGVYTLLCDLQSQNRRGALMWSWHHLGASPFLPRVRCGRAVLARAMWRLPRESIRELAEAEGRERGARLAALRSKHGWPRHVELVENDWALHVDLEDDDSIDAFLDAARKRPGVALREMLPAPDELVAHGPDGRYVHELVVPLVAKAPLERERPQRRPHTVLDCAPATLPRRVAPGGDWLYAKLYCARAESDRLLLDVVAPLVARLRAEGRLERWFFIRFGDPDWHIRLRLALRDANDHGVALAALSECAAAPLDDGRVTRLALDTYERELERYGGPEGITLAEGWFESDSDRVLRALAQLRDTEVPEARSLATLAGIDELMDGLGYSLDERWTILASLRDAFFTEFHVDKPFRIALGQRYRKARPGIEAALRGRESAPPHIALVELRRRAHVGRLVRSDIEIAQSFVHMFVNRMVRSAPRAQELVLYDHLERTYGSWRARRKKRD